MKEFFFRRLFIFNNLKKKNFNEIKICCLEVKFVAISHFILLNNYLNKAKISSRKTKLKRQKSLKKKRELLFSHSFLKFETKAFLINRTTKSIHFIHNSTKLNWSLRIEKIITRQNGERVLRRNKKAKTIKSRIYLLAMSQIWHFIKLTRPIAINLRSATPTLIISKKKTQTIT